MTDQAAVLQNVQRRRKGHRRSIGLYLALALPVCLWSIWQTDVISMEGIISLGADEMVRSGQWFVPKLYGHVYAFKPAMAYWLAAASQETLGRTEFALRLPFALCGVALGLAVYATVARLIGPRGGLYAALAAVTSGLFIEQARIAGYDMPLALGVGLATLAACHNLARQEAHWQWWLLGYTGLAFGFLAKGLPAVGIFFPGLLLASVLTRQLRQLFRWQHIAGVALFATLVATYLLLAYREQGWAAFADQLSEIGYRSARWNSRYVVATLVKPAVILAVFLPWSALAIATLVSRRLRPQSPIAARLALAAGAFVIAGMAVWMTMTTTSTRYYLPLVAPLAMLAGPAADTLAARSSRSQSDSTAVENGPARNGPAGVVRRLDPGTLLALTGLVYWAVYAGIVEPRRAAERSMRSVAALFDAHLPGEARVCIDTDDSCSSLFYYLGRDVCRWKLNSKSPPQSPIYMVLIRDSRTDQKQELLLRSDVQVEILAECAGAEKRTYALARIDGPNGSHWQTGTRLQPPAGRPPSCRFCISL